MIENVFGVISSSTEYTLDYNHFEQMVKYVLDENFNLDSTKINIGLDSINHETLFIIDTDYRDVAHRTLIGSEYIYRNERLVKEKILTEIFGVKPLEENIVYVNYHETKASKVVFKIENPNYELKTKLEIIKDEKASVVDRQIRILTGKKVSIIKNYS